MMMRSIKLLFLLIICSHSYAQSVVPKGNDLWDLQRCVTYALDSNISVQQQDIQARFSKLNLIQSKASRIPSLNFGANAGYSFGLSNNPTTGVLENSNFFNSGAQLQSQVNLFNWFSKKLTIQSDQFSYQADVEQTKKIQNDIALNVAVGYLQILLAKEQVNLAVITIQQTTSQLESTRKQVDAGKLPELNQVQFESQLATDSANYITATSSVQQLLLQLKALLSLDAAMPFDIVTPPVGMIPVLPLAELQPESVYASAIANLPQQKVNELRISAAVKAAAAAKAEMYPTISAFGSLGTNYVHFKARPVFTQIITGFTSSGLRADAGGGIFYDVQRPTVTDGPIGSYIKADGLGKQFRNNFGQNIGLNLNVPIFNGRSARTAWDRSRLQVENLQLTKRSADMQLKQDIYKAYIDATTAVQKFNANTKSVLAAQKAYDYATKRYDVGLLSTYELLNTQVALQTAKSQLLYTQYDYIFKMKLLEFYKGQGLKL